MQQSHGLFAIAKLLVLQCLHMLTNFHNICHRVYVRDNVQQKSYRFVRLTYIMLLQYLGNNSFQLAHVVDGLCRTSTLQSSADSLLVADPPLTKFCRCVGGLSTLSRSAFTASRDMPWQWLSSQGPLITQRLHSHLLGRWHLPNIVHNVKLQNNIREKELFIWSA